MVINWKLHNHDIDIDVRITTWQFCIDDKLIVIPSFSIIQVQDSELVDGSLFDGIISLGTTYSQTRGWTLLLFGNMPEILPEISVFIWGLDSKS